MKSNLHILLVDDDQRMTHTLSDILSLQGFSTSTASSGPEALQKLSEEDFDCVLTDIRMPGMNGVSLLGHLHQQHPHLPVVLMTAYANESLIQQGLDIGAIGVLEKPLDIQHLLAFFTYLAKLTSITVVDDDPSFCKVLGDILELRGYNVHTITDPHTAIDQMVGQSQVLLLDLKLNCITGVDIMQTVRERYPTLPVVLITGYRQEMAGAIEKAMAVNAHTCLYKPLAIPELLQTLTEIQTNLLKKVLETP